MTNQIRTDWRLFPALLLILLFGLIMVYSASGVVAEVLYGKENFYFAWKQLVFAGVGLALMLVVKRMDYTQWRHPLWAFVPLGFVFMLLLVVLAVDRQTHRWIPIGGFQFQPSEMAKPAIVIFLAYFVARRKDDINNRRHTLGPAALVVLTMAGLIGIGDLGTAIIILVPAAAVFFVAGIERRYFYLSLALAAMLAAGAVYQKPYRLIRLLSYVGLSEQKIRETPRLHFLERFLSESNAQRDGDHQPRQARIGLSNGHVFGAGLGNSNQKLGFLPAAHTDYIFAVVGEEVGLMGCLALLTGYLFIFWRGLRLYWITTDVFGKYLALGAVATVSAQALVNMSVVSNLLPAKGIPLPLISYGGSALICTLITLGILLSVSERSQ